MYDRNYKMRKEKTYLMEKFTCADTEEPHRLHIPTPTGKLNILASSKCIGVSDPHPKKEKRG